MELAGQGTLCADASSCNIGEKEGDVSELENTGNRAGEGESTGYSHHHGGNGRGQVCVPVGEGSHACAPLYLSVIGEEDTDGQEKGGNRGLNIFSFLYLLPAKPQTSDT